jgi:hypothetical protein
MALNLAARTFLGAPYHRFMHHFVIGSQNAAVDSKQDTGDGSQQTQSDTVLHGDPTARDSWN